MTNEKLESENKRLKKMVQGLVGLILEMPEEPDDRPAGYEYTDYCTGADGTRKQPYPKARNRQCSIGYHEECSDPSGEKCGCPCHVALVKKALKV